MLKDHVGQDQPKCIEPLTTETVTSLAKTVPTRYSALIVLAAGTGMRQGECWGLTVDRINFLRRTLTVDRQLVTLPGRPPTLTAPKTAASNRTIPLPQVVVDALAAHLAAFPASGEGYLFTTATAPRWCAGRSRGWSGSRPQGRWAYALARPSTRYGTTTQAC